MSCESGVYNKEFVLGSGKMWVSGGAAPSRQRHRGSGGRAHSAGQFFTIF